MMPVNLIPPPIGKSQISYKYKLNHRNQQKQRVLTHQSLKNTKSLLTPQHNHRANSSEARYDNRSPSLKKSQSYCKKKAIITAVSPKKQNFKRKQTSNASIRYYHSETKQQYRHAEQAASSNSNSNPWGGPNIARGLTPSKNSKQRLEEQRKALERLTELKKSLQVQQGFRANSVIKYKGTKKVTELKISKRPLPDYLQFIKAEGSYTLGFDFGYLRNLSRAQAQRIVDFGTYRVLQSILLCILDVLRGTTNLPCHGAFKLLKQYSLLYLRMFEKILTQFVIYHHIFKLIQTSVLSFLLHTRLCVVYLYQISTQQQSLHQKQKSLLLHAFSLVVQVTKWLHEGVGEGEKGSDYVISTFRHIQDSNKIEKTITQLIVSAQRIFDSLNQNERISEVRKEFEPLIKQNNLRGCQLQYLAQSECVIGWKFFGIPPIPYLPRKIQTKPYTLVLTLDHTLTFFDPQSRMVQYRPYLDLFLQQSSQNFELIIWSHQQKIVADLIIDSIERGTKIFSSRLYCQHYSFINGKLGRDLTRLGRPTETTILLQVKNENRNSKDKKLKSVDRGVIVINPFFGDRNDNQLFRILARLKWMTDGYPQNIVDRVPLHMDTLEHIEQVLEENNTITLSTH